MLGSDVQPPLKIVPRTVARLAAIQGVFRVLTRRPGTPAQQEMHAWQQDTLSQDAYDLFDDGAPLRIDANFCRRLVHQALDVQDRLIPLFEAALPSGWAWTQLERTTQALFLCAGAELWHCPETPQRVIFDEYITAAHSFLLNKGPAFVNALLDKTAPHILAQRPPVPPHAPEVSLEEKDLPDPAAKPNVHAPSDNPFHIQDKAAALQDARGEIDVACP